MRFEQAAVNVRDIRTAGTFVKIIDVLGDDPNVAMRSPLRQRPMPVVGLHRQQLDAPILIPRPHQPRVLLP
ncbi:Uncharacterised protein [Mycobacteroides abscessus subsp. abscessus]|nr:Uncharacterised protein [Mycobacteroides abscessus subsp. abscessus]